MSVIIKTYFNPLQSATLQAVKPYPVCPSKEDTIAITGVDLPPAWGDNTGAFSEIRNFMDFTKSVHDVGFFQTIYGKSLPKIVGDFLVDTLKEVGIFILKAGDLFFLMPAIAFMLLTFIAGKNKFTKWIIPLWFAYFLSVFFYKILTLC